jgi:3-phenylpropionate/cinnamic acid dioxygenase small subunit
MDCLTGSLSVRRQWRLRSNEVDDVTQVMNLLADYAHAVADERWDDWARLFDPKGHLIFRETIHSGTDDLRAFIEASHKGRARAKVLSANVKIRIDHDRAIVESDFCLIRSKDANTFTIVNCGRYRDVMTRGSEGWRFMERRIEPMYDA